MSCLQTQETYDIVRPRQRSRRGLLFPNKKMLRARENVLHGHFSLQKPWCARDNTPARAFSLWARLDFKLVVPSEGGGGDPILKSVLQ